MKLPAKIAYDLINGHEYFKAADVYMYDIPEDFQKETNLPIIRITEINDFTTLYASNRPHAINFTIQVDIWANDLQEIEQYYSKLNTAFIEAGWSRTVAGTDKDPDFNSIPRLYMRFRNSQKIEIN